MGLGFRVQSLGLVQGLGSRAQVQGLGLRVQGSGFTSLNTVGSRVWGLGFRVSETRKNPEPTRSIQWALGVGQKRRAGRQVLRFRASRESNVFLGLGLNLGIFLGFRV